MAAGEGLAWEGVMGATSVVRRATSLRIARTEAPEGDLPRMDMAETLDRIRGTGGEVDRSGQGDMRRAGRATRAGNRVTYRATVHEVATACATSVAYRDIVLATAQVPRTAHEVPAAVVENSVGATSQEDVQIVAHRALAGIQSGHNLVLD